MEEETILLSPDEVKKRRERKSEATVKVISSEKFHNRGNRVAINYETMGRCSIPETLYFRDYSVTEENDLLLVRKEDQLETTIAVLNKMKNEDANCKVEDMTLEEFFETLIGIKKQFDTINHNHYWICSCQNEFDDPKVNEIIINLNDLQYKSIAEGDSILKEIFKKKFESLTDENFREYIINKYKDNPSLDLENITKEEELERIQVKEPFVLKYNDRIYSFRFSRIGDLVTARKIAEKEFASKIKEIQNRRNINSSLPELKFDKKKELDKLKSEEVKYSLLIAQALTLDSIDGNKLTDADKIKEFSVMPRNEKSKIQNFMHQFKFGVQHEQEFTCPLCGKVDKRWIQREIDYDDLLPANTASDGNSGINASLDIYVGI